MTPQLSQKTKDQIERVLEFYANESAEHLSSDSFEEEIELAHNEGKESAIDLLQNKFDDLDSDFEFMKDHYDENGELPNKEIFKKLCCDFAKQIIN
jgi:hypothetical protein